MKFYKDTNSWTYDFWNKIVNNKLTATYINSYTSIFLKNGLINNPKNVAYIRFDGYKEFWLNGKIYGDENDFTKSSWRKFTKLQAFL